MKIIINQGTTFHITDDKGDIRKGQESGLYFQDTRYVSLFQLTVNAEELVLLSSGAVDHYSAAYYLTNPEYDGIKANTISFIRKKFAGGGLHEDLDIMNHSRKPVKLEVKFKIEADFADIFDIKQVDIKKEGRTETEKLENGIAFRYKNDDYMRKTVVLFKSADIPQVSRNSVVYRIKVEPKKNWHVCIDCSVGEEEKVTDVQYKCNAFSLSTLPFEKDIKEWFSKVPAIETDSDILKHSYNSSMNDLVALRIREEEKNE
jgi:hypothetical protein